MDSGRNDSSETLKPARPLSTSSSSETLRPTNFQRTLRPTSNSRTASPQSRAPRTMRPSRIVSAGRARVSPPSVNRVYLSASGCSVPAALMPQQPQRSAYERMDDRTRLDLFLFPLPPALPPVPPAYTATAPPPIFPREQLPEASWSQPPSYTLVPVQPSRSYTSFMSFSEDDQSNPYESRQKVSIIGKFFQLPNDDGSLTPTWIMASYRGEHCPIAVGDDVEILSHATQLLYMGRIAGLVFSTDPSWISFELIPRNGRPNVLLVPTSCTILSWRERLLLFLWTRRLSAPASDPQPSPEAYQAAQQAITEMLSVAPPRAAPRAASPPHVPYRADLSSLGHGRSFVSRTWGRMVSFLFCLFCGCISRQKSPVPSSV